MEVAGKSSSRVARSPWQCARCCGLELEARKTRARAANWSQVMSRALVIGRIGLAASFAALARGQAASAQPSPQIGARCLDCHASIVKSYAGTGMARALRPIAAGELAGLEPVSDADTGYRYRFAPGEHGADIVESWSPASSTRGAPPAPPTPSTPSTSESAFPLAFAIGAGDLDASFAARCGELLYLAPLEVLKTGGAPRATLSPGHSIQRGTRFTIPITEECIACHTDALPPRDYPLNLAPEASWKPSGISCAACHGPVDAHASWREAELAGKKPSERDPIVTTAHATPAESVSLCARCHLQGDARILLEPLARGVPPPGGDFLERCAVFVAKNPSVDVGFVSQVERLALSRCFTASFDKGASAMTCVTCHDPHRSIADADERARSRNACSKCHAESSADAAAKNHVAHACALEAAQREDRDCVQCHMRTTHTFDVARVEIHDHFIQRQPPPPTPAGRLRTKEAQDGELVAFAWPGRKPAAYASDPGILLMAFMSLGRPDLAGPYSAKDPGELARELPMYHHLRGSFEEQSAKLDNALRSYERALAIDPGQAETAVNLGLLLGRQRRGAEGIRLLDRVIAAHPKAEGALRNRAALKLAAQDNAGFVADLEAAQRIHPIAPVARALSQYFKSAGRDDLAEHWRAEALRLEPSQR
jgi:predicted CXXCH cytochrome family protein